MRKRKESDSQSDLPFARAPDTSAVCAAPAFADEAERGQQFFLIGGQQSLDTILETNLLLMKMLLSVAQGIGVARRLHTAICLYQGGIFQQSNDLAPDELAQAILAHRTIVTERTA